MLIGSYIQRIDLKGRTALPARFKKEIGGQVVIARWYESCLAIFSKESWKEMIEEVTTSVYSSPARDTERFLLGGAFEVELDTQGRFVIPPTLRKHAGLYEVGDVVFVGLNKRIEIWSKENWEEREQKIVSRAEELIEEAQKSFTAQNARQIKNNRKEEE